MPSYEFELHIYLIHGFALEEGFNDCYISIKEKSDSGKWYCRKALFDKLTTEEILDYVDDPHTAHLR